MDNKNLTKVAVIASAHGIRGQIKLHSYTTPAKAIFKLSPLVDAKGKAYHISANGISGKSFIASIKGITDRNDAELLRGLELLAPANALPEDPFSSLLHQPARLENGSDYGVVVDVANFGAGDVIEIKKTDGTLEMLPLDERFVEVMDGFVLVHPPEYVEDKQ